MKILITLQTNQELISIESLSLAFVLASFEHTISLKLDPAVLPLLTKPNSRLAAMLKSVHLYDIEAVFVDNLADFKNPAIDDDLLALLSKSPNSDDVLFDTAICG